MLILKHIFYQNELATESYFKIVFVFVGRGEDKLFPTIFGEWASLNFLCE